MIELLDKISSDNLLLLCVVLSVIALFLAIAVTVEIFSNYKRKKDVIFTNKVSSQDELNVKKDENIIYIEEDDELEKTKAKLELEKLKQRLKEEEVEKEKLLELNLELAKKAESQNVSNKTVVPAVVAVEKNILEKEENSTTKSVIKNESEHTKKEEEKDKNTVKPVNVVVNKTLLTTEEDKTNIVKNKTEKVGKQENNFTDRLSVYEELEEENAIISYDELMKATNFGYTDDEMSRYVDENDAIISITELEKLYKESNNIKEEELAKFEFKRVQDLPVISDEKKFQSTPFISPVYGVGVTDESISLEQTANLEKLNEEIKKTNEFLKTLKELKKNLQ